MTSVGLPELLGLVSLTVRISGLLESSFKFREKKIKKIEMKRSIVGGELGFVKKRRVSPPAGINTGPRRNAEDERFKRRR